jgi:uncharacterized protein YndB with AHSA1/START domain
VTPADAEIDLEVVYPHPVDRVWRALTDSAALAAWLMPNDLVPVVGHRFTFRTDPVEGWSGAVECQVTEVLPPRRLSYTWHGDPALPITTVTWSLSPEGSGCRLRLRHRGWTDDPYARHVRDTLSGGWDSKLLRTTLPALLDRLAAGTPNERIELS